MNVLITGAASGIGLALSKMFVKEGHNVYTIDVNEVNIEGVHSFKASITDEDKLNKVKDILKAQNIEFNAIINVAGIHMMASLVESDYSKMKRLIDINLSGTMLVNRLFHELLVSNGRILIVTSEVAGMDPMPFNGLYNVSKTALDCYAQALRQELNLIGQKVITIRPGAIKTPLASYSIKDTEILAKTTKLYSKQAHKFSNIAMKFMGTPIEPEKLSKLIYKATIKKNPKIIYKKHQNLGLVLLNILPKRMQCFVIKMLLK